MRMTVSESRDVVVKEEKTYGERQHGESRKIPTSFFNANDEPGTARPI